MSMESSHASSWMLISCAGVLYCLFYCCSGPLYVYNITIYVLCANWRSTEICRLHNTNAQFADCAIQTVEPQATTNPEDSL